jgi:predicted GIY-YIG superfamily endonuclease
MYWIYILRCEDGYFYVGQTKRLYRRFWEHTSGNGGLNTKLYIPENIVAIYNASKIYKFVNYNEQVNHVLNIKRYHNYSSYYLRNFNDTNIECVADDIYCAENNITECLMLHKKNEWDKIRGGKYVRYDIKYTYPNNKCIEDLPLCKCGLPCDIKKNEEKNYLFFRCAKKNMWDDLKDKFDINDNPCNFYMEYTKDIYLRTEEKINFEKRRKTLSNLFKISDWLKYVDINDENSPYPCVGGCCRTSQNIKMRYDGNTINLCYDCFIDNNDELKNKFEIKGKCLINI